MSKDKNHETGSSVMSTSSSMRDVQKEFFAEFKKTYKDNMRLLKDSRKVVQQKKTK